MYESLGQFITALEKAGEVQRITRPTSALLSIAAAADVQCKAAAPNISPHARQFDPNHCDRGGQALIFEDTPGCDFPLAINVFGSYRRMEMALGCTEGGYGVIADKIAALAKPEPPKGFRDMIAKAKQFAPLLKTPPKRKKSGRCQDVVKLTSNDEVNLLKLPLIKCWPADGEPPKVGINVTAEQAGTARGEGRYITFAGMHTIHADDRDNPKPPSHNIGMYRAQLVDETHLAMHWHMHHDGAAHWRSWKKLGAPMPIAICLGGESVLPYAATAPLPPGISELLMAGFLNGGGIPMVRAKTVPLWVPANSEFVIEGFVNTDCEPPNVDLAEVVRTGNNPVLRGSGGVFEGPFGDHTGFYSLPDRYPLVDVTAITHCNDPIFPATIVGLPPQEDYYIGKATERIFLPLLQTLIHDIEDYHLPMFGCFHNCAFVKIHKAYPLQARRVMHAIWGAGQMAWTKIIVVVDDDVDVHDEVEVMRAMSEHTCFKRDVEFVHGPLDILDHAAPRLGAGGKIGFDATRKIAGENVGGIPVDLDLTRDGNLTKRLAGITTSGVIHGYASPEWSHGRVVFLAVDKPPRSGRDVVADAVSTLWNAAPQNIADFVIVVDAGIQLGDWQQVLFHWAANFDPSRDRITRDRRLAFDATTKTPEESRNAEPVRPFPPVLTPHKDA